MTNYKITNSFSFDDCIKYLKKRFPNVKTDVRLAVNQIIQNPTLGMVQPGGGGPRKLRVRNTNLNKGKSSGYRLIYYVVSEPEPTIYLLLLYAKSDRDNVTHNELRELLKELDLDLK